MLISRLFGTKNSHKQLNLETISDIEKRLNQISKSLKKNKLTSKDRRDLKKDYENLRTTLVVKAFTKKKEDSSYEMPARAQKVYNLAKKITINPNESKILPLGEQFAFLTSNRHFIHKHIETLEKWNGPRSSKPIINPEGKIKLRTYPHSPHGERIVFHDVNDLIEEAKQDDNLVFDLTFFSLEPKEEIPQQLKPSFKIQGDGHYHAAIMTDCPTDKLALSGQHTWMRLIDPQGNVMSIGKFPKKIQFPFLYAKEASIFCCPDQHEWLCRNNTMQEHRFQIDEDKYNGLVDSINKDLKNASNHDFNFFKENCSDWVIKKLEKFDILKFKKSEIQVDQINYLFPAFEKWHDKMFQRGSNFRKISNIARSVLSFVTLQIARVALVIILGGMRKNKENEYSKRFLNRPFKQIFDPTITTVTPPIGVRRYLNQRYLQNKIPAQASL